MRKLKSILLGIFFAQPVAAPIAPDPTTANPCFDPNATPVDLPTCLNKILQCEDCCLKAGRHPVNKTLSLGLKNKIDAAGKVKAGFTPQLTHVFEKGVDPTGANAPAGAYALANGEKLTDEVSQRHCRSGRKIVGQPPTTEEPYGAVIDGAEELMNLDWKRCAEVPRYAPYGL